MPNIRNHCSCSRNKGSADGWLQRFSLSRAGQAPESRGLAVLLEKVTVYALVAESWSWAAPGIALDGRLVSSGAVPSTAEVENRPS